MKPFHVTLFLLALSALTATAEDWPGFRGPIGQGISTEKGLPLHWSATSNVLWKVEIPGQGWSSPITWGDRIFITTATANGTSCRVLALDRKSGRTLWNREVFVQTPRRKEGKNSYATPTPVADARQVYAVFGDGSMAALTHDGAVVWTNREVAFYSRHGLGASPLLYDGMLIMPFDGSNQVGAPGVYPKVSDDEKLGWQIPWDRAMLVAVDAKTGQRRWTGKRGQSRIAHVTPNVLHEGGETQIISCAGDAIQGFDPKTGERLWTVYSQGEGVTPSFVMAEGLIFTSSGFEKTTLRTVRTGGKGDVTSTHIAWEQKKGAPTQPSLVYVKPYLHAITDGGIATCYEAKTGEVVYQERVGGNHCASPIVAEDHIYFHSEAGETTIIKTGPKFEIVARNALGEKCQASLVPSQGCLFIRTEKNLFCIGNPDAKRD